MVFSVDLELCQSAVFHNSPIYKFLFIQRIPRDISVEFPAEFPPHVTMVWYLSLVKGVLSKFCRFLNKEVGVESSEKLMKELANSSPWLGLPQPK